MRHFSLPVIVGGCAALLALASCNEGILPPPDAEQPITIAASFAATGSLGQDGTRMEKGFRLAVDMLNEAGGIDGRTVRLVTRDDGSNPETAARLYQEFVATDSIDLLLGPYSSSVTEAVIPVAEAAGMPLITPLASAPELWEGRNREWSVQMMNSARTNIAGAVEVAARHGAKTVALVYEDSRFPVSAAGGARAKASELGLRLVMDQPYPIGGANHEALAAEAKDARADLFLGGGYTQDAVAFTKAVAAVNYEPVLMSWNVGPGDPAFAAEVGELARCLVGNAPWVPSIRTSGFIADSETFVSRYSSAHGVTPGYSAAAGFGAVELLAEAVQSSLTLTGEISADAIRDYLFSTSTETVLGPFGVAPRGDEDAGAQQALVRLQVQWQDDGEGGFVQRIIHPESVAEAPSCTHRA